MSHDSTHHNTPRVSTDEIKAQIRSQLEAEQQLTLTKELLEEHRAELEELKSDMEQMRPWFRAGRWVVGALVSAAIGWVARGGPAKPTRTDTTPCLRLHSPPALTHPLRKPHR
jgi:negative regulator of sigma E activity